jgi:hypothetical protein
LLLTICRIRELILQADKSKDGKVAWAEFLDIMVEHSEKELKELVLDTSSNKVDTQAGEEVTRDTGIDRQA